MGKKLQKKTPKTDKTNLNLNSNPNSNSKTEKLSLSSAKNSKFSSSSLGNDTNGSLSKKPTVRSLVTSSQSWTGKLPTTLLHEHCQKLQWEKVNYDCYKTNEGFIATVILSAKNLKTQEIETVKLRPPDDCIKPQGTFVEAKNLSATYALHRIASHKNIQMVLPRDHKEFWKKLEQQRKINIASSKAYLYSPDPFLIQRERKQSKEEYLNKESSTNNTKKISTKNTWAHIPYVDINPDLRAKVENCIKQNAPNIFATKLNGTNSSNENTNTNSNSQILNQLLQLGFRHAHIQEALQWANSKESALIWLLIHVPEDDIPEIFNPPKNSSSITIQKESLQGYYAIKRLSDAGYSMISANQAWKDSNNNEPLALHILYNELVFGLTEKSSHNIDSASLRNETWDEEMTSLNSIYGESFSQINNYTCKIKINVSEILPKDCEVFLQITVSPNYPDTIPSLEIICKSSSSKKPLPTYLRLEIVRKAGKFAFQNYLQMPMIFSIIEWIENNINTIIQNPGPLSDLSLSSFGDLYLNENLDKNESSIEIENTKNRNKKIHSKKQNAEIILKNWEMLQEKAQMKKSIIARQSLPAWEMKYDIINTVKNNRVTLITGETGSGKSTQSLQFIMDDMINTLQGDKINIVCTQPRRISAIGLAERVSEERCVKVGDEIGYSIRGETKTSSNTKLRFVTTRVLLRMIQSEGIDSEISLQSVSHIVVDEVHERSLDNDLLLIILKRLLKINKKIKIILMSATVNSDLFMSYFKDVVKNSIGHVFIKGKTFPVQQYYLDDIVQMTNFGVNNEYDDKSEFDNTQTNSVGKRIMSVGNSINYSLIAILVSHIDKELGWENNGSILIFLPGLLEIKKCIASISSLPSDKFELIPLHASLSPSEQKRVFFINNKLKRRIIVSTNVAETSITIPDTVVVIDSGRVKETIYYPDTDLVKLSECWVSRAAAKQRAGRAGRICSGYCYKLYTCNIEENKMLPSTIPEIKRTCLDQLYLDVKGLGVSDVKEFLSEAIDAPESLAVEKARVNLFESGALKNDNLDTLTNLGTYMTMLPLDLRCSKFLIYSSIFGCLDSSLTIAAIFSSHSPFLNAFDKRELIDEVRRKFSNGEGDMIAGLCAFNAWKTKVKNKEKNIKKWCMENYLVYSTLTEIESTRVQILQNLYEAGVISSEVGKNEQYLNTHEDSLSLIRSLISAAFYPRIARIQYPDKKYIALSSGALEVDPEARTIKFYNKDDGRVFVHPSSTLFSAKTFPGKSLFLSYFSKLNTGKIFIRDITPAGPFSILMFGGELETDLRGRGITIGGWIRLRCWVKVGVLSYCLRILLDQILAKKLNDINLDISNNDIIKVVRTLLETDGN